MSRIMKGDNIAHRLLVFTSGVVRMCRALEADFASRHVMHQLVRAATGGGANYEEARGAESRADFVHKTSVAAKEVREALYWLRLIQQAELVDTNVARFIQEANELVAILSSSVKTARRQQIRPAEAGELQKQGNARNREQRTGNGNRVRWQTGAGRERSLL